jgi:hypothetical protein
MPHHHLYQFVQRKLVDDDSLNGCFYQYEHGLGAW